jgi:large subunit ribosomal protein L6
MSRIGKKPIIIPEGVEVKIEGQRVAVKGPKGELWRDVRPEIKIEKKDNQILVMPQEKTKKTSSFWGMERTLIANMVEGVIKEYEKKLELKGVGYKVSLEGGNLVLKVGFSHSVLVKKPEDVNFAVDKNIITVSGIDKARVGQIAAQIRKIKPPEPYKGKGIRYLGEEVKIKTGKKAVGAAGA